MVSLRLFKRLEAALPLKRQWLRTLLLPLGVAAGLLIPFVLLFTASIPIHNYRLEQWSSALRKLVHPPGTRRIGKVEAVANFGPTGNGCDYLVAELRTGRLSRGEVERFYAAKTVSNPLSGGNTSPKVMFLDNFGPHHLEDGVRSLIRDAFPPEMPTAERYAVLILDGGHDPGFDFRCQ